MRKLIILAALAIATLGLGQAPAKADWAIAIGQKGSTGYAWGTAWNYTSEADARKNALSNCRSNGPNCKVVATGAGQCIGLAIGLEDNAYGWAQDKTKRKAGQSALDQCTKYSNGDCEVKDVFCDE
jgi:Domain of unknown function (DUF4189)